MKQETLTQYLRRRLLETVGQHAQIALDTGVPQTTISRVHCGTSSPTAKTMEPLIAYFRKIDAKAERAAKRAATKKIH